MSEFAENVTGEEYRIYFFGAVGPFAAGSVAWNVGFDSLGEKAGFGGAFVIGSHG
jgi:hypothetical protein